MLQITAALYVAKSTIPLHCSIMSRKVHTIPHTLVLLMVSWLCARGQTVMITWNGIQIWNNSLVTVSVVAPRGTGSASQHPLLCQGITGGQWYDSNGALFPLATSTPGGLGQQNVSGGVELYQESSGVFPYGVQCCTNTTITLCVGMYSDLTFAAAANLSALNKHSYAFFEAATYGPNITGGVQFQLLTPTNVDSPVFQLTCTSTGSPPTNVLWTINGILVSNSSTTSSQIVTQRPTSAYNNTLTVTGRVSGNYTCTVTTTCSPVCGGFTLNPRSINSSLTVQAAPEQPVNLIVRQTGPEQARASWGAPISGGRVSKYLIYCTGFSEEVSNTSMDLSCYQRNLQDGVNVTVIAMGYYLPSVGVTALYREVISSVVIQGGGAPAIAGTSYSLICTVTMVDAGGPLNISWVNRLGQVVHHKYYPSTLMTSSLDLYHAAIRFSDAGNYTCRANAGPHQSYTVVNVVVQNATAPLVSITSSPNKSAGESSALLCVVTHVDGLPSPPTVTWGKNSKVVHTSERVMIGHTAITGNTSRFNLTFNPLATSDGGVYNCTVSITLRIDCNTTIVLLGSNTSVLVVKVPPPIATITFIPITSSYYIGTSLNLTCSFQLIPQVNTNVTYKVLWTRPEGWISSGHSSRVSFFSDINQSTVQFHTLSTSDTGMYNCSVHVFASDQQYVDTSAANISSVTSIAVNGMDTSAISVTSALPGSVDDHTSGLKPSTTFILSPTTLGQNPKTIPTILVVPIAGTIGGAVIILAVATTVVIIIVLRSQKKRKYHCHDPSFFEVNPNFEEQPFFVVESKVTGTSAATLQGTKNEVTGVDLGEYLHLVPSVDEVILAAEGVSPHSDAKDHIDAGLDTGENVHLTCIPNANVATAEEGGSPKPPNSTSAPNNAMENTHTNKTVHGTNNESIELNLGEDWHHVPSTSVTSEVVLAPNDAKDHIDVGLDTGEYVHLTPNAIAATAEEGSSSKPPNNTSAPNNAMENTHTNKTVHGTNNESIGLNLGEDWHHIPSTSVTSEVVLALSNAKDPTRLINVASFHDYVQNMHKNGNRSFELEYKMLQVNPGHPQTVATLPCNVHKCRYANILPYNNNRVKLKEINRVAGSDFINASYIDGYKRENCYIATQGPTDNTTYDFWRMVWEGRLQTIVMLTKCSESRKNKCEMYWSDTIGGVYETDSLTVTTISNLPFTDFDIRKFTVQSKEDPNADCLEVTHFQYTAWPDHGVPQFASSMLSFVRRVQKVHDKDKGVPLLVHCSAGVGRTGTFIALDTLLDRMRSETSISVLEVVRDMRSKRVLMVQTLNQYVFIHDALDEYITCGNTGIVVNNLRTSINSLSKIKSETNINGFHEQFLLLDTVSHKPFPDECSDGAQPCNKAKNRYENILPYNLTRPLLGVTGPEGSDYINASFVDSYKQHKVYIATQGPLQSTVEDFWRMVWEFNCRVIVMLCPLTEESRESSYCYWPTEKGSSISYGSISVTSESMQSYKAYEIRRFFVIDKSESRNRMVTQLHYTKWSENGTPTNTTSMAELMDILSRTQIRTGNKPIVVHCNDGVGRTGAFITMYSELKGLKAEGEVDVFQRVKFIRRMRPGLVRNVEQYAYCHEYLAHYVDSIDVYGSSKEND